MKKVVGLTCVRMNSSRLPGKCLREVAGKPLLGYLLDRMQQAKTLDAVVVATSTNPENEAIAAYCATRGVPCYRADNEDDVTGRMLGAYEAHQATIGVEVFGDGVLVDPTLIDQFVTAFLEDGSLDFLGNDLATSWPPGMEVEVFTVKALKAAAAATKDPAFREHGTLYIRQHPEIFQLRQVNAPPGLHRPELEIEVDTEEDFAVIEAIITHFNGESAMSLEEIIAFLDANPAIRDRNRHVPRRWKEARMAMPTP